MNNKLVLFDIDGTLIHHVTSHRFEDQYEIALKQAYDIDHDFSVGRYNGKVDRFITWDIVREHGVSREEFLKKFPSYIDAIHKVLESRAKSNNLFIAFPEAVEFITHLSKKQNIFLGVITGNAQRIAHWKLSHTGIDTYFPFGLYGDEADDRNELAHLVFEKAKQVFHTSFLPTDITVIGDTVNDIRCGKAIGAYTIGVTTGMHGPESVLQAEKPDLVVDTLMDKRVLDLFSLK
jgi:phosphoglycolate phosphatase